MADNGSEDGSDPRFLRVYELAMARPFVPFRVVMHSGREYPVHSHDHIFFIRDDEGTPTEELFEVATKGRVFTLVVDAISSVEVDRPIEKQV
jgi:hypothetical protein